MSDHPLAIDHYHHSTHYDKTYSNSKVLNAPSNVVRHPTPCFPIPPTLREIRSKHILNAQVSIRAPCCKQWFDCSECHAESETHKLAKTMEMAFMCKKCRKAFRKDMTAYEESDEFCPHCDNHYVRSFAYVPFQNS